MCNITIWVFFTLQNVHFQRKKADGGGGVFAVDSVVSEVGDRGSAHLLRHLQKGNSNASLPLFVTYDTTKHSISLTFTANKPF